MTARAELVFCEEVEEPIGEEDIVVSRASVSDILAVRTVGTTAEAVVFPIGEAVLPIFWCSHTARAVF